MPEKTRVLQSAVAEAVNLLFLAEPQELLQLRSNRDVNRFTCDCRLDRRCMLLEKSVQLAFN